MNQELTDKIEKMVVFTDSFKDQEDMTREDLNKAYDMLVDIEDCMSKIMFKPTAALDMIDIKTQINIIKDSISELLNQTP
jgi:hypothetical protein